MTAYGASYLQSKEGEIAVTSDFTDERFADIQLLRYSVPHFGDLTPRQRRYAYYLSEAALWGRDILWDQNCSHNLAVRRMLESVYLRYEGDRESEEFRLFTLYLKRVWFSNGIHHHYGSEKLRPGFTERFLRDALAEIGEPADEELLSVIFSPTLLTKRVATGADAEDLLQASACNYYSPEVTQRMAEDFYDAMRDPDDPCPVMYGMNSRLELRDDGELVERTWRSGGMYGGYIDKITHYLALAAEEAENEGQRTALGSLIEFYLTGDLRTFDRYTIEWLRTGEGDIDYVNGFTEVYGDPLGLKASWEGYVNIKDKEATKRAETLSRNAQWFEDNSPIDSRFKKTTCRGVTAKVVEAVMLGGDLYPSSAIGINLPNSDWVRERHGSKSVTIGNLTHAYNMAAKGNGLREEFVIDEPTLLLLRKYDERCDDLHTDLHECLGHGSGQTLPGVAPDALKSYGSTIEEARADLFALYYIADVKLVELGLTPDQEAYKSQYYSYMMNGLLTQLARVERGKQIEEAHMRDRALIARWCLRHGKGAMELTRREGKTFLRINDYKSLRATVAELLREVQRIKSEGDLDAARKLVEGYGVDIDTELHDEVLARYGKLNLAPYKGFINPVLKPVYDEKGNLTDATLSYGEAYDQQMLRYGRDYSLRTTEETLKEIKMEVRSAMNGVASQYMRKSGLTYHVNLGVELPRLREIASRFARDHAVAQTLWHEDARESKILATLLMPTESFYPEVCDVWASQIPNAEIAQTAVLYLFSRLPYASDKAFKWMATTDPTLQLCGFLLATRLHIQGNTLSPRSIDELVDQAEASLPTAGLHLRKAIKNALTHIVSDRG